LSVTCDRSVVFSVYSDFLHQYNWPPLYYWNVVESGVKHHKPSHLWDIDVIRCMCSYIKKSRKHLFFKYCKNLLWIIWKIRFTFVLEVNLFIFYRISRPSSAPQKGYLTPDPQTNYCRLMSTTYAHHFFKQEFYDRGYDISRNHGYTQLPSTQTPAIKQEPREFSFDNGKRWIFSENYGFINLKNLQ
jgi:hypothetical protein